jgi:hypothetical protein
MVSPGMTQEIEDTTNTATTKELDIEGLTEEDKEIIENLELLENLEWLMDIDLELLENLEVFLVNS